MGGDVALIREALRGAPQARERLLGRLGDLVWTACTLCCADEAEARAAFAEVVDRLPARLRPYDGSSRLETFAGLVIRDLLAIRLQRLLAEDAGGRGWAAFERFFQADLRRIVQRRMPGPEHEEYRRDAYQEICLALLDDGCRRLKAWRGEGSFAGFVLHMVDRLAVDILRRVVPRRRSDAAPAGPREAALTPEAWDALPSPEADPGQAYEAAEDDRLLAAAIRGLRAAAAELSDTERLYLRVALGGGEPLPAREVARLMGRPVEEVYKIRPRVMAKLKAALDQDISVKLWRESV